MTRNIDRFVPPLEQFHIWGEGFTDEECDNVAKFGELFTVRQGNAMGRVGGGPNDEQGKLIEEVRKSPIAWIEPNPDTYWIFDRMNAILAHVNFHVFQNDLDQFEGFQYSKYKAPGGHYTWHTDTVTHPQDGKFRKISCVLMLTDETEYEGGNLELNINGDQNKPVEIRLKKGQCIFFYSHIPHRVTPVTKGLRLTLVTWALGPKPC